MSSEAAKLIKGQPDNREHINIVFIGHVDAGKSTVSGQTLLLSGRVDKRTIERYEKEAKDQHRDSWYLAYIMDLNEDERQKGITKECGAAPFETEKKRITLLDAPGHKAFVPAMITGASQADLACLVISARKGEFEAGFEQGGQTLEHMLLAKTVGINKIIVLINKMDEQTVKWSKDRYDEIVGKLSPAFAEFGFNPKKDVIFLPISAYTGAGMKERIKPEVCSWFSGKSFFEVLDDLPPFPRMTEKPVRLPISARNKDMGVLSVMGKLETGILKVGDELITVPNMKKGTVTAIEIDNTYDAESSQPGEHLTLKLKGLDEDDLNQGYVLCSSDAPCHRTTMIEAQLLITDLNDGIPILSSGFSCVMHAHTATVECKVQTIIRELNKKNGKVLAENPKFLRVGSVGIVRISLDHVLPIEKFEDYPMLSRFTLRDKGKTIGIGKVLRLKPIQ